MATPIVASAVALDGAIAHLKVALRAYIEATDAAHAVYKRQNPGRSHHRFDATTDVVRELLLSDALLASIVGRNPGRGLDMSLSALHAND